MGRVLVATPTLNGYIRSETHISLANLDPCGNELVRFCVKGYDVAQARNEIVRTAIHESCDHVLMVDSDMIAPSYALEKLKFGLDVCMGWYVRGTSDVGETCAVKERTLDYGDCYSADELEGLSKGADIVRVKANGMGCALVRTSVFERIPFPWFKFTDFKTGQGMGEDYWFCHQCSNAGIKLYVHTGVRCGHIHERVL